MKNKVGFAYYAVETDRYQDIRIKKLKRDFGCCGIAVYDYLLCEAYRVKGCYVEWNEDVLFNVSEYFALTEKEIAEIVLYCCEIGLFNKSLLEQKHVLSSQAIQNRFVEWSKKAKRINVILPEECTIIPEESPKLPEEPVKTPDTSGSLPQSKVKKRKEKESISLEEEKTSGSGKEIPPIETAPPEPDHPLRILVMAEYPKLLKMKEPLTNDECKRLEKDFSRAEILHIFSKMQNYTKLLSNNESANRTARNWLRDEKSKKYGNNPAPQTWANYKPQLVI